jgi:hypothetical protein
MILRNSFGPSGRLTRTGTELRDLRGILCFHEVSSGPRFRFWLSFGYANLISSGVHFVWELPDSLAQGEVYCELGLCVEGRAIARAASYAGPVVRRQRHDLRGSNGRSDRSAETYPHMLYVHYLKNHRIAPIICAEHPPSPAHTPRARLPPPHLRLCARVAPCFAGGCSSCSTCRPSCPWRDTKG